MAEILEPFAFDAVYGAFSGRGQIDVNGKQVVAASVARLHRADQRDNVGFQYHISVEAVFHKYDLNTLRIGL